MIEEKMSSIIAEIAGEQVIWVAQSEKFIGTNDMSGIELYVSVNVSYTGVVSIS